MKKLKIKTYYNKEGVRADSSQQERPSNASSAFTVLDVRSVLAELRHGHTLR